MGFKIGDRVQVVLPGAKDDGAIGVIVENTHTSEPWAGFFRARLTSSPLEGLHGLYRDCELVPIAPRGPKPLTLTGGTRFTSNRAPAWIAAKWNLRQRPVRVEIPLPMEMPWSTQP